MGMSRERAGKKIQKAKENRGGRRKPVFPVAARAKGLLEGSITYRETEPGVDEG